MNGHSKATRPNLTHGTRRRGLSREGFTLLELMIAMVISTIVLGGVMASHSNQSSIHRTESQISDMQQNLRGALFIMAKEIRMAGYDPTRKAKSGIQFAGPEAIQFSYDITDNDGTPNSPDKDTRDVLEEITYWVGNDMLIRKARFEDEDPYPPQRQEPVAMGVDAISFSYAFDADVDGDLETSGGQIIWAYDSDNDQKLDTTIEGTPLSPTVDVSQIRSVQVTILAKTRYEVLKSGGSVSYTVGHQGVERSDGFRRQVASIKIMCRNMGL